MCLTREVLGSGDGLHASQYRPVEGGHVFEGIEQPRAIDREEASRQNPWRMCSNNGQGEHGLTKAAKMICVYQPRGGRVHLLRSSALLLVGRGPPQCLSRALRKRGVQYRETSQYDSAQCDDNIAGAVQRQ
jgi:hypothetical protein